MDRSHWPSSRGNAACRPVNSRAHSGQTTATSRIDGSASAHRERKAAPVQYAIVAARGGFGPAVLPTKAISHGRLPSFRGPVLAPGSAFITNGLTLWEFRTAAHAPDTIYTSH